MVLHVCAQSCQIGQFHGFEFVRKSWKTLSSAVMIVVGLYNQCFSVERNTQEICSIDSLPTFKAFILFFDFVLGLHSFLV